MRMQLAMVYGFSLNESSGQKLFVKSQTFFQKRMHRSLSSFCSKTIFLGADNFNGIHKQIDLNGGTITPTLQILER